jgi:hypothetical protein
LQIDHIHPRSRGGSDRVANLALACEACNRKKGSQPVDALSATTPASVFGHHRLAGSQNLSADLNPEASSSRSWRPALIRSRHSQNPAAVRARALPMRRPANNRRVGVCRLSRETSILSVPGQPIDNCSSCSQPITLYRSSRSERSKPRNTAEAKNRCLLPMLSRGRKILGCCCRRNREYCSDGAA